MHHVAIMNPEWNLIPKILSGEKTIESRWYLTRRTPWNTTAPGDTVWFKDSGKPVTAKATVSGVIQFENYSDNELRKILKTYGPRIAFPNPESAFKWCRGKKYAVLIMLSEPKPVKPFAIDKKGFGNACAWIALKDISTIRKKTP